MAKTYTIDDRWRNGRGAGWTPNYDDWYADANAMGLYNEFSAADLNLARQNPYAGYGILWSKYDYANAPNDEARALANGNANFYRSDAGGYTAGTDGNQYQSAAPYGMMAANTLDQVSNYSPFRYGNESAYQAALNKVINPEAFSYDMEADPVWQSLRTTAEREGTRAMKDTLGQVSARTGGLASSYGASAAAQANNYYLEKLNDQIPTLYRDAYNRYLEEYQMQRNALDALRTDKSDEYGRYGDTYNRLLKTLAAQQDMENTMYNRDRTSLEDARQAEQTAYDRAWDEDNRAYSRGRDAVADARYADETAYSRGRDTESDRRYYNELEYARGRDAVSDARYADELAYDRGTYAGQLAYNRALAQQEAEANSRDAEYTRLLNALKIVAENGDKDATNALLSAYLGNGLSGTGGGAASVPMDRATWEEMKKYYPDNPAFKDTYEDYVKGYAGRYSSGGTTSGGNAIGGATLPEPTTAPDGMPDYGKTEQVRNWLESQGVGKAMAKTLMDEDAWRDNPKGYASYESYVNDYVNYLLNPNA